MRSRDLARSLTSRLRPLDAARLGRVSGGDTASTSTSGTPEAGDDTVGDSSFNNLKQLGLAAHSYDDGRW
jgi:hypothetical protein